MKLFKRIIIGLTICFAFLITLASCSNVSKSFADKINESYQNGNALTYESVKDSLGEECIDLTKDKGQSGLIYAVKGLTAGNYKEKLSDAKMDDKYEFITITLVQGKCTYAYYQNGTRADLGTLLFN